LKFSVIRLTLWTLALLAVSLALGLHSGPPELRKWSIKDNELPALKIALFADFHFSSAADLELLATLKRQLIKEDPEIVLFAGDYIGSQEIYKTVSRATIVKSLEALAYPKPAFAVLGNHDNWDSNKAWQEAFDESSILLIDNRIVMTTINEKVVCIRGLGDIFSNQWEYVSIPEDCQGLTITLTHDPAGLLTLTGDIETVSFAGHTHCGQIAFPLIGAPIVPTNAPKRMHCGQFRQGKFGVVSGGLGTSIIPIRFGPSTRPGWELIMINSGL
jgi:predicted MPP superfamily phosphohydrolase